MKRPEISYGFCALVCLLAWLDWKFCLWFLLCALCHELGHLAAMKLCRVPGRKITLGAEGAVIHTVFPDYKKEILCAAAGPVAGAVFGAIFLRLAPRAAIISFLLSAVNLLPLYPLDGGRILRASLLLCCSETTAAKVQRTVTIVLCCVLMLLACWAAAYWQMGLWPIFAVLVLLWRAGDRE